MDVSASDKKIERAKKHIGDLIQTLTLFAGSDFYSISVDKDSLYGTKYLHIDLAVSTYEFLTDCGLIIGDTLHNLRSALDLLYYQTIGMCGGKDTDWTTFPVRETRQKLEAVLNSALEQHQITKRVRDFIVDTIKPYKAGNPTLCALHDLNITDKHKLLIPTFQMMTFTNICLENQEGIVFELPMLLTEIPVRRRLNEMLADCCYMTLKVKDKGKAATGIGFQFGFPLQGESVLMSLNGIAEEVTRTIKAFELFMG